MPTPIGTFIRVALEIFLIYFSLSLFNAWTFICLMLFIGFHALCAKIITISYLSKVIYEPEGNKLRGDALDVIYHKLHDRRGVRVEGGTQFVDGVP